MSEMILSRERFSKQVPTAVAQFVQKVSNGVAIGSSTKARVNTPRLSPQPVGVKDELPREVRLKLPFQDLKSLACFRELQEYHIVAAVRLGTYNISIDINDL